MKQKSTITPIREPMDDESLVSVIIPTFKRANLVQRAIECVRRQTYSNLEILVIDDCSPDNTGEVVRAIPDNRIRYIRHEKNMGLPAGRNTGIHAARGEYIAFLDDDDEWREDKLDHQLQAIRDYDAVLCTALANGIPLRVHERPTVSLDDLRRGSFDPSSLLAKASVLRDVKFDENLRQGEDWDAFIRIAQRYTIGWVKEPLLLYNDGNHVRMTSEAKTLSGEELEKRIAVLQKHREFFGKKWFKYHLADTLLAYIGSRSNKVKPVAYAIGKCGLLPVFTVIIDKIGRRMRSRIFTWTR
jgi:GalNAc5-diNAcBac-PP-undecaprenol beta-1,3-glucosyltransferase